MSYQRLYTAATKGARHSKEVNSLQYAGFTATISPKKNINLGQFLQLDLFQVSDMVDLQTG